MRREERIEIVQRNLKRFREEMGERLGGEFSQQDAAEAAGMPLDTYRSYERGGRAAGTAWLLALAKVYARPVEHFFEREPPPPPDDWQPVRPVYFRAPGLDDDLRQRALDAIEQLTREQLDRNRAVKLKGRRGKKL